MARKVLVITLMLIGAICCKLEAKEPPTYIRYVAHYAEFQKGDNPVEYIEIDNKNKTAMSGDLIVLYEDCGEDNCIEFDTYSFFIEDADLLFKEGAKWDNNSITYIVKNIKKIDNQFITTVEAYRESQLSSVSNISSKRGLVSFVTYGDKDGSITNIYILVTASGIFGVN